MTAIATFGINHADIPDAHEKILDVLSATQTNTQSLIFEDAKVWPKVPVTCFKHNSGPSHATTPAPLSSTPL